MALLKLTLLVKLIGERGNRGVVREMVCANCAPATKSAVPIGVYESSHRRPRVRRCLCSWNG